MKFDSASSSSFPELKDRADSREGMLQFGIDYLDDACTGIRHDDLVLVGAPSGAGKTQLCCAIALANMQDGKKVHFIALEAGKYEIERRLKFPLVFERFLADPNRPRLPRRISFSTWLRGDFLEELKEYENAAAEYFEENYRNLFLFYKDERFGHEQLIDSVLSCADETDLIILDHIHYFDFDDDNENRAIREIAKTAKTLVEQSKKPIILVAHLRKRDKANEDLVAGQEEFMGSSDLFKISTKVITLAPGKTTEDGLYETFFRVSKNRLDGGVLRFIGREFFNPKRGSYEKGVYKIGWSDAKRKPGFEEIDRTKYPEWSRFCASMLPAYPQGGGVSKPYPSRTAPLPGMPYSN